MVIRTIKLTSLFVNTENYRFEPLSSQKEAIDKMIEDQGDKLYSLVDDIVTNGLSPVDLIIVTPNEDSNKYVVLEGNRRITSLKLLNNPTLIDDKYSPLRKKFQKLQKEKPNAISELKNIACAVFETPTEADIWIKRKHSGELKWYRNCHLERSTKAKIRGEDRRKIINSIANYHFAEITRRGF